MSKKVTLLFLEENRGKVSVGRSTFENVFRSLRRSTIELTFKLPFVDKTKTGSGT